MNRIFFVLISSVIVSACGDSSPNGDGETGGSTQDGHGGAATGGAGGAADGGHTSSGGQGATSATGGSTGTGGAEEGAPIVELTFSGSCTPELDGAISVATNADSIAVYSQNPSGDSSIQLALQGATGLQTLSTQHRVDTGIVINLIDDGATWTNIASDQPDPITGTMDIIVNQQASGIVEVDFVGATLVQPGNNASACVLSGHLETFGTFYSQ